MNQYLVELQNNQVVFEPFHGSNVLVLILDDSGLVNALFCSERILSLSSSLSIEVSSLRVPSLFSNFNALIYLRNALLGIFLTVISFHLFSVPLMFQEF